MSNILFHYSCYESALSRFLVAGHREESENIGTKGNLPHLVSEDPVHIKSAIISEILEDTLTLL